MNKFLFMFLFFIGMGISACSDSGKEEPIVERVVLTSDKPLLTADGKDKVVFTVRDKAGTDVTASCVITVGATELVDNVFSTKESNTYKVIAKSNSGLISNEISVVAIAEDVVCTISADKKSLLADGGDLIQLTLTDENGNDVSSAAEFYADGKKIEGTVYRTTEPGQHMITARLNGKEGANELMVAGLASLNFTGRLYVEEFTATSCRYCKNTIEKLAMHKEEPRLVLVSVHSQGRMFDNAESFTKEWVGKVSEYYNGEKRTPSVFFSRNKTRLVLDKMTTGMLKTKIPETSDVAISIVTQTDETAGKINVSSKVAAKKSFNGKIFAVLVENGIMANQVGYDKMIEMRQVMRAMQPSLEGEAKTFNVQGLVDFSVSFQYGNAVPANCEVVVVVTDKAGAVVGVQHVVTGKSIGY